MNLNPQRSDWFFPIEEAPVFALVTRHRTSLNVRVPHKKALEEKESDPKVIPRIFWIWKEPEAFRGTVG